MMHPRNIYNKPADFNELSKLYPDFAEISKLDITGKVKLDFKNPESVRVLSKCCLRKDFDLEVDLPVAKLLPTIPLRLNYLLWIEDLLSHVGKTKDISEEVTGVDIGCGASCIYCLLMARMNSAWKMFALEIDDQNLIFARDNVKRNKLDGRISVIAQVDRASIFGNLFVESSGQKTFCTCNPPFFSSADEVVNSQNRTGKRKPPKSANSGSSSELVFEGGGELEFVRLIVNESVQLGEKIQIYSSMLGCKKNLQLIIDELQKLNIENFTTTEFVQGKTTRWGIAWSFNFDLKSFKSMKKLKEEQKHILTHEISTSNFDDTVERIKATFNELKISVKIIEQTGNRFTSELSATENTWSNQRRKRRAQLNHVKLEERDAKQLKSESLSLGFEVRHREGKALLKMFFISGTMSKDCANQILQFIKNKFK